MANEKYLATLQDINWYKSLLKDASIYSSDIIERIQWASKLSHLYVQKDKGMDNLQSKRKMALTYARYDRPSKAPQ